MKLYETKIVRKFGKKNTVTVSMEGPYESDRVAKAAMISNLKSIIGCLEKSDRLDVTVAEGERVFVHHRELTPAQIDKMEEPQEVILS